MLYNPLYDFSVSFIDKNSIIFSIMHVDFGIFSRVRSFHSAILLRRHPTVFLAVYSYLTFNI